MLIRSQDKERIFDTTGSNIGIGSNNQIYGFGNTFGRDDISVFLGAYQTKERAIEVLDEICNTYISLNKQVGREYNGQHISGYFGGYVKNGVYQMPEV